MKAPQADARTRLSDVYAYIRSRYFHDAVECEVRVEIPVFIPPHGDGAIRNNHLCHHGHEVQAAQYDGHGNVIRFHPVLFRYGVPRYVLRYLMYHGMAHALLPPAKDEDVHHDAFIVKENIAPYRNESSVWLAENGFPLMTALPRPQALNAKKSASA